MAPEGTGTLFTGQPTAGLKVTTAVADGAAEGVVGPGWVVTADADGVPVAAGLGLGLLQPAIESPIAATARNGTIDRVRTSEP